MAGNGGNWNSFMQSKQAQVVLYGICVFCCVYYAVDGIMELMSPERSAGLIAAMGEGGYYAMTVVRCVVLVVTAIAFGRIVLRSLKNND